MLEFLLGLLYNLHIHYFESINSVVCELGPVFGIKKDKLLYMVKKSPIVAKFGSKKLKSTSGTP